MKVSRVFKILSLVAVVAFTGCGRAEFEFSDASRFGQTNPPTVCLPGTPTTTPGTNQNGLAGKVAYLTDAEATAQRPTSSTDLLTRGKDAGVKLILNQLNIPGVNFSKGFIDPATGKPLEIGGGAILTEWFAIDMYGEILLSDTEAEGYYQLALISDDGSTLYSDATETIPGTKLIDNDGEHATRMGCGANAVYLKKNQTLPIRVKYYQGPRQHIALTLLWRKVSGAGSAKDAYCGLSGNDVFWDSTKPGSPATAKYNDLVARGWKVPAAKNFILPPSVRNNPCTRI